MGGCCSDNSIKDTPEALLLAAECVGTPAGCSYKEHEHSMLPEIKSVYREVLLKRGKTVEAIEIREKLLKVLDCDLISKIVPDLNNLKVLILFKTEIDYSGANKLADTLSSLSNLEELDMSYNNLQDNGFELIAQTVLYMKKLKNLNFSNNQITSAGAEHLIDSLSELDELVSLDLSGNKIDSVCLLKIVSEIEKLHHFRLFKFEESFLKPSQLEKLNKRLQKFKSIVNP